MSQLQQLLTKSITDITYSLRHFSIVNNLQDLQQHRQHVLVVLMIEHLKVMLRSVEHMLVDFLVQHQDVEIVEQYELAPVHIG